MKNIVMCWGVLLSILGGFVYAAHTPSQPIEEIVISKVAMSDHAQASWEKDRARLLGVPITGLDIDTPIVSYSYPDQFSAILKIVNKHSDISSVIGCDARTGVYTYAYHHGILEGIKGVPTDFAIMQYKEGTDIVYESDLKRTPIFSSSRGDVNLKESLNSIKGLPDTDLISFVVEQTGDDYITKTIGWGPTFTVKEFKAILNVVNFDSCEQVDISVNPVSF